MRESINLSFTMDRRRGGCQIPLHYSTSSSSLPSQPPLVPQPSAMAMSPFHDDQEYRYSGRVRMRKWLINQVLSGRYIGLKWIDKDKTLLRIPWKHGSRSGWSVEDGKLFESWAIQSGKFDPLHPNARKWKANFRCALRSLPDVDEVKNLSHKTGKDAYKIFKFLPEKQRKRCYKSSRPWRQPQSKTASKQSDAYERQEAPGSIRPKAFGRAPEPVFERKPHPSEMLHPVVPFLPPPPPPPPALPASSEDHRRLCYPLGVLSDVRHSPSRFWASPQPPQPLPSAPSSASEVIGSAFTADLHGSWSFRTHLHPPPPPPPNVSDSLGFSGGVGGGQFEGLTPCDQYSNSFGSSPSVADPPSHPQYRSAAIGSQPYAAACDAYASVSDGYSGMTAYEAPYFNDELPSQPEMTDISNLSTFPQWPNATENFMAEVFDVMQQVLRDRCGMTNESQYAEDVDQYEVKVIHP